MLPFLYPDPETRDALLADPQSAPIPDVHKELFAFAEKFVQGSWTATPQDLDRLRVAGLSDRDIVQWATLGSTQSWFTMSADGGGVPLEGDALTGPGVGRPRDAYGAGRQGSLDSPIARLVVPADGVAWVDTDESHIEYRETALWAEQRYGCVPNLLRAVSLQPAFYRRHRRAFELLEAPQTERLSPLQHAMVRVRVSWLNGCRYSGPTTEEALLRAGGDRNRIDRLRAEPLDADFAPADRVVLALATKFARHTYKVTEKDAIALREVGLDDEAYVDVLNTVSIQTSLDRLANVLGVAPDPVPLLPDV